MALALVAVLVLGPANADTGETPASILEPLPSLSERQAQFEAALSAYDGGDYRAAFRQWLPLARLGDPAAQRNVGHLYRQGLGVTQDFARAAQWYRRAADSGLPQAQANLAMMYLRGQGVREDPTVAARWFLAAALQQHARAQYNLGLMYFRGVGVERNEANAAGWFYLAAKGGHEPSLAALAQLVPVLSGPQGPMPAPEPEPDGAPAATPPPAARLPETGTAVAAVSPPATAAPAPRTVQPAPVASVPATKPDDPLERRSLMRRFLSLLAEPDENLGNQIERLPAAALRSPVDQEPPAAQRQPQPFSFDDAAVAAFLRRLLRGEDAVVPQPLATDPPRPEVIDPP